MPAIGLLLVIGGAIGLIAASAKKQPAGPSGPSVPGVPGVPGFPLPPGFPGVPATLPGVPTAGAGATTSTGCPIDANYPQSLIPALNETLTRGDLSPELLQGLATANAAVGFPLVAKCLQDRAAGAAQSHPSTGAVPRPPWYPAAWPWPPTLPGLGGPAPTPQAGDPNRGWGQNPIPGNPFWPPPGNAPAGWQPLPQVPAVPGASTVPGEVPPPGDIPPPAHGGVDWGPRPAGLPATFPWPPMAPIDPAQNPTVGSSVELQIKPGDTAAGYAAYYSGHGPGYVGENMEADIDMGSLNARFAELAILNPNHAATGWKSFQPGAQLYVSHEMANARGVPPVPTHIYQAAGGFVPRPGMDLSLLPALLGA